MLIIETPVFTKRILEILTDDEYRGLQHFLIRYPEAGVLIPAAMVCVNCVGKLAGRENEAAQE